jgi:hypothetical protein
MEMHHLGALEESKLQQKYCSRPKKGMKHQAILEYTDENGIRKERPPTKTMWYLMYRDKDKSTESSRWAKKF